MAISECEIVDPCFGDVGGCCSDLLGTKSARRAAWSDLFAKWRGQLLCVDHRSLAGRRGVLDGRR